MTKKKSATATKAPKATQKVAGKSANASKPKPAKGAPPIFQFQIALLGTDPPVWRRIQVEDCTFDRLHEHIQTAMGWTNSHLHQFKIAGQICGDPAYLDDGWNDVEVMDSMRTTLDKVLANRRKRFRFHYEYDFGDSWEHEIAFEGRHLREPGVKYPICLEGERACPPEDIGGVWGYYDLLDALVNPESERRDEFFEWCEDFNPDEFDAVKTTKAMGGKGSSV